MSDIRSADRLRSAAKVLRERAEAARAVRVAAHGLDHGRTYRASEIKVRMYGIADRIEAGEHDECQHEQPPCRWCGEEGGDHDFPCC